MTSTLLSIKLLYAIVNSHVRIGGNMTEQEINEKRNEQVMHSQGYAIRIEHISSNVLGIKMTNQDGLIDIPKLGIDALSIRKYPYHVMKQVLFYLLGKNVNKKEEIEKFSEDYAFIKEMSIDTILSFVTDTYEVNGWQCNILEKNGEIFLKKMIDDFKRIVNH